MPETQKPSKSSQTASWGKVSIFALASCLSLTTACGPKIDPSAQQSIDGVVYPEWVMKGSGAFGETAGRVFYGVGSVSGIKNHALARTTAENRARSEIGKIFETYTASLMKDYASAASDGEGTNEEQYVEQALKTFSAATLSGVEIVDRWFHPDGSVYALSKLDLEAFTNNLERMEKLNEATREYVRKNAERAHVSLEAEEAKRQQ